MELSDPSKGSTSLTDAVYRRIKNRERQRRYRERKRLRLVGTKVVRVTNQTPQLQIMSMPTDVIVEQAITRVHCKRDWKKDARRVHAAKQEAKSSALLSSSQPLAGESQMLHFPSGAQGAEQTSKSEAPSASMRNSQAVRSKPGRRNWKSEARSKRN